MEGSMLKITGGAFMLEPRTLVDARLYPDQASVVAGAMRALL
jgi:hypothetical protein